MKVVADERRRITLPQAVHPGDVFELEQQTEGRIVLVRVQQPVTTTPKLVESDGFFLLTSEGKITWDQTRNALDEFP
jgi:hypothetical protein